MRLLLDTHTFLWFIRADPRLSAYARQLIESSENERLLSVGSLWEMAIKSSLGKLELTVPFTELVGEHIEGNAIELLQIAPHQILIRAPIRQGADRRLVRRSTQEREDVAVGHCTPTA